MKKIILTAIIAMNICCIAGAQDKTKIKKTSSPTQTLHNVVSKHKKYNGYKVTTEKNGVEKKHKVNTKTGEVKNKTDKDK
ncbi:MAG: hypothetical protein M3139_09845 [Bacteroidota bacterium]|nr:hypothetical protein [Bacteroidota bacterium]